MPVARCASCGFGTDFTRDRRGCLASLTCHRDALVATLVTPVAEAVPPEFACVARDAPLAAARGALERDVTAFGLPVVDERGGLVGILGRARAMLMGTSARSASWSLDALVAPIATVSERASLAETFASMRERGTREMAVVGEDRVLVGVLRDIDALRAIASSRRTSERLRIAG